METIQTRHLTWYFNFQHCGI